MSLSDALKVRRNLKKEIEIFLRPVGRKVTLRGGSTDVYCFEKIFVYEEYRTPFELTDPKLIIDGGANVGMASLYFAAKYPQAIIYAIEPEVENFKILQRNCAHSSNIILKRAALWPTKEKLSLTNTTGNDAWSFAVEEKLGEVETITIDQILEESGAGKVDLLKLDIEGSERELFMNEPAWLNKIDQIAIELHDRYKPGCSQAFYSAIINTNFRQELRGENVFVSLRNY